MQGRAGVSYISISFPDGTFQGAYRDGKDGALRFQDSRVGALDTVVKRFSFVGHQRIEPYLGCIGFFLLSGRLVFERNGSLPMMAHITEPLPDLTTVTPNYVPAELAALLEQCLPKKPELRPSDARAPSAALKAIRIPAAEQWTEAQAQAWWATAAPSGPASAPRAKSASWASPSNARSGTIPAGLRRTARARASRAVFR
ncbi:MAG TPA: hypothetical protein VHW01_30140 [Polyangiaceae bacterium]|nr:hypothetical protein [Polyangiaceae bacterium]